eukprot:scaffold34596_cov222-Amphora_coffeaeformis.AAC.11
MDALLPLVTMICFPWTIAAGDVDDGLQRLHSFQMPTSRCQHNKVSIKLVFVRKVKPFTSTKSQARSALKA